MDIVCITETWLNNSIPHGEVIKKKCQADQLQVIHQDIEQIFIKVKLNQDDLVIGSVYIPPNSDVNIYEKHIQDVVSVMSKGV